MRARLPDDLPRPARRPTCMAHPCIVAPNQTSKSKRKSEQPAVDLDPAAPGTERGAADFGSGTIPKSASPRPAGRRHCRPPPRLASSGVARRSRRQRRGKESGHHARSRRRAGWRAARLELAQPGEQALRGRSAAGHRRKHAAAGGLTPSPDAHRLPPMFTLCRDAKTGGRSHTCRRTRRLPCGTVQFDLGSAHETSAWTRSPCNPRQIRRPPPPSDLLAR